MNLKIYLLYYAQGWLMSYDESNLRMSSAIRINPYP